MSRTQRVVLVTAASLVVFLVGWTAFAVWFYVVQGGVASLHIVDHREGLDVYLPLPASVLELGADLARRTVQHGAETRLPAEVAAMAPALVAMLEALEEAPDTTFVEVEERGERVRIFKRGRALIVEVDGRHERIVVSAPARTVRRAVSRLVA